MTAEKIFEEFLSREPLTQESVIDALNKALDEGYREGYEDAISDTPEIDFIPESDSLNDSYSLN